MTEPILTARHLLKAFPGVRALNGVNLTLMPGTIHALLGENGAGKSTLIKILTGIYQADGGELVLAGQPFDFRSPHDATAAGIGVVHQERNLVPQFSVAENITLQDPPRSFGVLNKRIQRKLAQEALDTLGVELDLSVKVAELSVAQMQLVEIAKALVIESKVLLLDEPTASITVVEAERLFDVCHRLAARGTAVIFVSHKLEEVFGLCDVVTVLRDGVSVLESAKLSEFTMEQIVDFMVGRQFAHREIAQRDIDRSGTPALRLSGISTSIGHRDISFEVYRGEILGLYGLVGAGRSELARSLLGLHPIISGRLELDGKAIRIKHVRDAVHRHGIGYVTENRKDEGLFLDFDVRTNIAVTIWQKIARRFGRILVSDEDSISSKYVESLSIKISSTSQIAGQLSGGNQQKVSLARWLAAETRILFIDEPTVGIDVRTKAAFHDLILDLANQGLAIVLISSDLPEMVALADRVVVVHGYRTLEILENDKDYLTMSRRIMTRIQSMTRQA
jgi:ribose transport system ATP-binding protein